MIVIGVDVHKQSLTAVAVDEAGRMLAETTVPAANNDLLEWACGQGAGKVGPDRRARRRPSRAPGAELEPSAAG